MKSLLGLFGVLFAVTAVGQPLLDPDDLTGQVVPRVQTAQEPNEIPTTTMNVGVESIDSRMYRIFHELTKKVSARVTSISDKDYERINGYYGELQRAMDLVGIAGTDTCATDIHGWYFIPLSEIQEPVVKVENEAINSAIRYLLISNLELRKSQSTRRNDCLEQTDYDDLKDAVNKSKAWLDSFFMNDTPMDMPQSHPQRDIVEPTGLDIGAAL